MLAEDRGKYMLYIPNESRNPYYNLALEEYLLKNFSSKETLLLLWQNVPSVIVGRFQNTLAEVNLDFIKKHQIHVVRRISGGGAVYHDLGNLNFTFIAKKPDKKLDFWQYTAPMVNALAEIGVQAECSGRNDLTINGKKFSGNAQYHYQGKVMHHGTLLFTSDLDQVEAALHVQKDKFASKGVNSVRSRVTNIKEHLPTPVTLGEFKKIFLTYLFAGKAVKQYSLTQDEIAKVKELMKEKYLTWAWNYGSSPAFNFQKSGRFSCGGVEVCLHVEKGLIKECRFYGDFFSNEELSDLEQGLKGLKYEEKVLRGFIATADLQKYFGQLHQEDFLKLFLP